MCCRNSIFEPCRFRWRSKPDTESNMTQNSVQPILTIETFKVIRQSSMLCTWINFIGCTHVDRFVQKRSSFWWFSIVNILLYFSWEFCASTFDYSVKFTSYLFLLPWSLRDNHIFDVSPQSEVKYGVFFQIILFCGCWNVKEVLSFVSLEHVLFYALLQMRGLQICAVMFAAMCVEVLVQTLRGTWGSITPQHWQNCNVFVQLVISFFNLWTQVWNNMTIQGIDYMLTKPRGKLLFPILTQLSY